MITPVLWWNAQHGWVSFEFQGGRGVPNGVLRPAQFLTMVLGEIAFLSPWIFVPLVAGFAERVPSLAGRTAPVSALPKPACNRPFQLDAALGRPRPTSLDDARLVFCVPIDGRMGRGTRRTQFARFAARRSFRRRSSPRSPASRSCKSSTGWPLAILTAQSPLAIRRWRLRMARSCEGANLRRAAPLRHLNEMVGRGQNRARSWASDSCFCALQRSARLGFSGREREFCWAKRGHRHACGGSRIDDRHRSSVISRASDSPSFTRWVGVAVPRSSLRSFPLLA